MRDLKEWWEEECLKEWKKEWERKHKRKYNPNWKMNTILGGIAIIQVIGLFYVLFYT